MRDEEPESDVFTIEDDNPCPILEPFTIKAYQEQAEIRRKHSETWKRKYKKWVTKEKKRRKAWETKHKNKKKELSAGLKVAKTSKDKEKIQKAARSLESERNKYYTETSPPFPASDVEVSYLVNEVAEGEYIEKIYDPERLVELTEMSQRLKSSIVVYATNAVKLGIAYRPTYGNSVAEFDKEESVEYNKQGVDLIKWYNTRAVKGTPFAEIAYEVIHGKVGIGEGYFEVIDNNKGAIGEIKFMSAVYLYEAIKRDRYIWVYGGSKKYFKRFEDKKVRRVSDFSSGATKLANRATRLLPYKEFNLVSDVYGCPVWTGAIPQVIGSRYAAERNVNFFSNDAPQPLNAKIMTPIGWSTMGAMQVGSEVIGSDGKARTVIGVYPQGKKDVYRIKFFDDSETECTLGHLWTVTNNYDRQLNVTRTMTLEELLNDGLFYESGSAKWAIPMVDPVEYEVAPPLPIDAYLMGLLLGDGSFRGDRVGLSVCGTDSEETQAEIISRLPEDIKLSRRDRHRVEGKMTSTRINSSEDADGKQVISEFNFVISNHTQYNEMTRLIRELGLLNVLGDDKFIPEVYLRASVKDRISLLQGLIDSDGTIGNTETNKSIRYVTVSKKLAEGIKDLVGSLGGTVTIRATKGRRTLQLTVRQLPKDIIPVRLSRKVKQYVPSAALRWRTIISAELVKTTETQCIMVDVEDHLYVTDDFILTHNTPRMAILIMGGALDNYTTEAVKRFFRGIKGRENSGRVLVLSVSSKNQLSPDAKPPVVKLEPLTVGKTDDGSFMKYQAGSEETIREAFRQALTFYGTSGDSNRASSYTLRDQTVEMVYKPESEAMAFLCNDTFTDEWAVQTGLREYDKNGLLTKDDLLAELYFLTPRTMSEKDAKEIQISELSAGALTINDYRAMNRLPKIDRWWAELSKPLLVPAIQMAALAPEVIATLTPYDEFAGGSTEDVDEDDEGTLEETLDETDATVKALIVFREAMDEILKEHEVSPVNMKRLDTLYKMNRLMWEAAEETHEESSEEPE